MNAALLQRAAISFRADTATARRCADNYSRPSPDMPTRCTFSQWRPVDLDPAEEAEELFRKSLARAPQQPSVRVNLANFLRASNRTAEAESLLRETNEWPPDSSRLVQPGRSLLPVGTLEGGTLRRRSTTLASVCSGLGTTGHNRTAAGRLAAAIAACRKRASHAARPRAFALFARSAVARGLPIRRSSARLRSRAGNGFETPELYGIAVRPNLESGDSEQALHVSRRGVSRYPDNALLTDCGRGCIGDRGPG